jgi:hypothetical protein
MKIIKEVVLKESMIIKNYNDLTDAAWGVANGINNYVSPLRGRVLSLKEAYLFYLKAQASGNQAKINATSSNLFEELDSLKNFPL